MILSSTISHLTILLDSDIFVQNRELYFLFSPMFFMCCAQLSDNNRQIELLTEQIRIMNQRFFGRKSEASVSEVDSQISLFDSFNEVEYLKQDSSKEPEIT